jgi:hypothetical protein
MSGRFCLTLKGYHEMALRRNAQQPDETSEQERKEVENIVSADAKTLRPSQRAVLQMLNLMESIAIEEKDDEAFGEDIAAILLAEDEATMWDADNKPRYNAKVLSGCELELYGIDVKFSNDPKIDSSLIAPISKKKMYVMIQASRLNNNGKVNLYRLPEVGEEFQWNTSARFIVAKLMWLLTHKKFDDGASVKVRLDGTDLDGGKEVVKLQEFGSPVLTGQAEEVPF